MVAIRLLVGTLLGGGILVKGIISRIRHSRKYLTPQEEDDCAVAVDAIVADDDMWEGEDVAGVLRAYTLAPRRSVRRKRARSRLVRDAVDHIRFKLGSMLGKETPANILVVMREYRAWAQAHNENPAVNMRHSVANELAPLVQALYFVQTEAERRAEQLRHSNAYLEAQDPFTRQSWRRKLAVGLPWVNHHKPTPDL